MGGIFGFFGLDGQPADPAALAELATSNAFRGPDGLGDWLSGPVALGHAHLHTTPEAPTERQPLPHAETGCVITGEIRLDNRAELFAQLDLPDAATAWGDAAITLHAYLRWGEAFPGHLEGDFALALFDPRHNRLILARDRTAIRQVSYWHQPGRLFVFSTEAEGVVAHPAVPRKIDEVRVGDFLCDLSGADATGTWFEGVLRLPQAHMLIVDPRGLRLVEYWQLAAPPRLVLKSDADYEAALLDVLRAAVRPRLRTLGPPGLLLSGGIDSGSVASVASEIAAAEGLAPIHTFSGVSPAGEDCSETRGVREFLAMMPGLVPTTVGWDEREALHPMFAARLANPGEPDDLCMNLHAALGERARTAGVRAMLDGKSADTVLCPVTRTAHLLEQGRFLAALAEARGEADVLQIPELTGWIMLWQAAHRVRWMPPVGRIARTVLRRNGPSLASDPAFARLAPDFAARYAPLDRAATYHGHWNAGPRRISQQRINALIHPIQAEGSERYDRVLARAGLESRDPWRDRRMLEFSLSLPPEQLQRNGWLKHLLRRSMAGRLPDSVLWRKGRNHVGHRFSQQWLVFFRSEAVDQTAWVQLREFMAEALIEDAKQYDPQANQSGEASDGPFATQALLLMQRPPLP